MPPRTKPPPAVPVVARYDAAVEERTATRWLREFALGKVTPATARPFVAAAVAGRARRMSLSAEDRERDGREATAVAREAMAAISPKDTTTQARAARIAALANTALAELDAGFATAAKKHVAEARRAAQTHGSDMDTAMLVGYAHETVNRALRVRAARPIDGACVASARAVAADESGDAASVRQWLLGVDVNKLAACPAAVVNVVALAARTLEALAPDDPSLIEGRIAWRDLAEFALLPSTRPAS